jgi:ATP-dependent Clp protease ATP-binding subunit ClpC
MDEHAAEAVDFARHVSEQARLGHIGTEHLLLGLLQVRAGTAARILESLGATLPRVEAELIDMSMTTQRIILSETMASSVAEAVFRAARQRADAGARPQISTTDLLVALVQEHDGVAAKVLAELGVRFEQVAAALAKHPG